MKIFIFLNTEGFLGGWGIKDYVKTYELTSDHISTVEASKGTPEGVIQKKNKVRAAMNQLEKALTPSTVITAKKKFDDAVIEYREYTSGLGLNAATPITQEMINELKESATLTAGKGKIMIIDMPTDDVPIFHNSIDSRDHIEVLPSDSVSYDAQFGNLKLKFNESQSAILLAKTKAAHKLTAKQPGGLKSKHDQDFQEIFSKIK